MLGRSVLVAVGVVVALLGTMLPAGAQPETLEGVVVEFDSASTSVFDLGANLIGSADHSGTLRCYGDRCAGSTQLEFTDGTTVEYRFRELVALDPVNGRVVAAGEGVISDGDGRQKFAFTAAATAESAPNEWALVYEASRPDASFVVIPVPGTATFFERP